MTCEDCDQVYALALELARRVKNVLDIDQALYANSSRDFGRGFNLAFQVVREALDTPVEKIK